jgi:hypothetical protein
MVLPYGLDTRIIFDIFETNTDLKNSFEIITVISKVFILYIML